MKSIKITYNFFDNRKLFNKFQRLPPLIEQRNEKLKEEMMGELTF